MLYRIADLFVEISFGKEYKNGFCLIPSFEPFKYDGMVSDDDLFFRLHVDDSLPPKREGRERIRSFDTGNGDTVVDKFADNSYQYIIKNIEGKECCLLQADAIFTDCKCALNGNYNMRQFGLNNALMLAFAFAGSRRQTLLIHASLVRCKGWGYAFTAKSGTGKSTQVSNWLRYIPGCDIMNDDNPIIRIIDGKAYVYGGPWSGKTPCYRNVKAPLGGISHIKRDNSNWVERLKPVEAFATFLPSCSSMMWDDAIFNALCDSVTKIVETTPIYYLHCLPDRESAEVCYEAIHRD